MIFYILFTVCFCGDGRGCLTDGSCACTTGYAGSSCSECDPIVDYVLNTTCTRMLSLPHCSSSQLFQLLDFLLACAV
jgi:hypothetical protein